MAGAPLFMKPHRFSMLSAALLLSANALANPALSAQEESAMPSASTMLRPVNPAGAVIPGISSAVVVESGRMMFLSGHVPMDAGGAVLPPDLESQLDQVFKNLSATLEAAGATPRQLARITIYVRDFQADQLPAIRRARDRFIDQERPPASTLIGAAELFHPNVLVEVDAIAVLPPDA
jgi:enamine deaminase RidA (YjgF/YER057c/UK114 family)